MDTNDPPVRVLLVDDEEDFLAATSKALTRRGFTVRTAASAAVALRTLRAGAPDVAVFDVKMPDADGHELYRRVRQSMPDLPIVILTGHGTFDKAFELSRAGVFDYLSKPIEPDRLAEVLLAAAGRATRTGGAATEQEPAVLLVDDERDFLDSISKVLRRRGFTVHAVDSGAAGLQILESVHPEVAVVDVRMPGMDGLEFLRRARESGDPPEIILLTGHASVTHAFQGVKEGAFDYLAKPYDVDELAGRIRAAATRRNERRDEERRSAIDEILRRYPE